MENTSKTIFVIGMNRYYVSFSNDLKDRVIYTDSFGSHYYKNNGKIIYFSNLQEDEFREIRKKYD